MTPTPKTVVIFLALILFSACEDPKGTIKDLTYEQFQARALETDKRLLTCKEICSPAKVEKAYVSGWDGKLVCKCL